ncbi:MAG: hypothetical protein AVDCRST_MAG28-3714 [uncultured Rubrobacteraceae bacterium]|uniref:DUF4386 family protein n=1 Tax=uncultured Rubrobacteraceae bacterium TaxID=349277 RepID=A0A6J4RC09_9ACTN|nr:MAG: hypothetical protein AVDCRST_MAG28-3714 [uncultured Rubrobacteraceae bacterium]
MAAVTGTSTETRETGGIGLYGWTVLLLILEPILMFAAFFILNGSINWPASLDEPAKVNLPLIIEQRGAVILGYGSYLLYSLLILPLAVMLYFALKDREASPLLAVAAAVGVISALARALGIVRWLFLMPALADIYLDPASSEATREAVTVAYAAFNEYAGGVGEILGVGFTGALWVGLTSIALLRSQRFPKWIGLLGILAAVLLLPGILAVAGLDFGSLFAVVGGNVLLIWMIALAVVLFRSRRANWQNL